MVNEMVQLTSHHNRAKTLLLLGTMVWGVGSLEIDGAAQHTVKASEFTLSVATGNIGGGQPQPEFLGSDWEATFGDFEKLLGVMALTTKDGDCNRKWDAKYERYANAGVECNADSGELSLVLSQGDKALTLRLPVTVADVLGDSKTLLATLTELELPKEPTVEAATDDEKAAAEKAKDAAVAKFNKFMDKSLQDIFTEELKEGKGFSGPEACLKSRMAYPYFEKGFVGLSAKFPEEDFMQMYLRDLRGTKDDLAANLASGLPVVKLEEGKDARAKDTASSCKAEGARSDIFTFNTQLDWWYLALWDVYVLKAYTQWTSVTVKPPEPMTYLDDGAKDERIVEIAGHFLDKAVGVDIFFAQESSAKVCAGVGADETRAACRYFPGKKGEHVYDAAVFLKEGVGKIEKTESETVWKSYKALLGKVEEAVKANLKEGEGKMDTAKKGTKTEKAQLPELKANYLKSVNDLKTAEGKEGDAKFVADALAYVLQPINIGKKMVEAAQLPKVELAVAKLKSPEKHEVPVLLMSAHPDSDGKYCAFLLFLAKKVFEANKETLGLKYMIVGMDTNVQTDEDFKAKAKNRENGYNFAEFQKVVEGDITATITMGDQDQTAVLQQLGYTAMWPTDDSTLWEYKPTVHKVRTFLQAQLHKAAKYDRVVKDVVFLYEAPADKTLFGRVKGAARCVRKRICRALRAVKSSLFPSTQATDDSFVDVQVINTLSKEKKESFRDEKFPKEDWPMDHSVSKASVSISAPCDSVMKALRKMSNNTGSMLKNASNNAGSTLKAVSEKGKSMVEEVVQKLRMLRD